MSAKYYRKPVKDIKKSDIIVFDLDGCIMNSDDYVLTNEQAWKLDKSLFTKKPNKEDKDNFCIEYLRKHQKDVEPYRGIFELFVRLACVTQVIIVTARFEIMKQATIDWLKENCVKYFDEMTWRKVSFKISFNEKMEKSLAYKKKTFKKLMENYNILLLVEDHPEVIAWAKSKKIDTLVPATGYKDLNGTDLMEKEDA